MDLICKAVISEIMASTRKRVKMETILARIRKLPLGPLSDFEIRDRLLEALTNLADEDRIRLPKIAWDRQTGLPHYVTAVRTDADIERQNRKKQLYDLRYKTAWEPTRMVAFAHTLKSETELNRAKQINRYLLTRKPDTPLVPHRERALAIFRDEKALDPYVRHGLFNGRITLSDLDCFYCPEPLPYDTFSPDRRKTGGKPLLVVENANTYWSCCQANETLKCYAAVVYGQGFKACAAESASDGLSAIGTRVAANGIFYFGDLDPTGIAIPMRINSYRKQKELTLLYAERRLYRALMQKNLSVPYVRSHEKDHDPDSAGIWLGEEIAERYLKAARKLRWPQEGVTLEDIVAAIRG